MGLRFVYSFLSSRLQLEGLNPDFFVPTTHSEDSFVAPCQGFLIRVFCTFEITLAALPTISTGNVMHSLTYLTVLEFD